jgi:ribosomal protein S24E
MWTFGGIDGLTCIFASNSDILHPGQANISKDALREKLATMYKASKDQVSVFGLRTQFGGGKTTGFGLVYDSPEAMKKFEPAYRLIRVGFATKPERASRQQRMLIPPPASAVSWTMDGYMLKWNADVTCTTQASNARTDRRLCEERPRSRAPRRRRRNKRIATTWGVLSLAEWVWLSASALAASVHYTEQQQFDGLHLCITILTHTLVSLVPIRAGRLVFEA